MNKPARHLLLALFSLGWLAGCSTLSNMFGSDEEPPLEGTRLSVTAEADNALPQAELKGESITLPDEQAPSSWVQFGLMPGNHAANLGLPDHQKGELSVADTANAGHGAGWSMPFSSIPVATSERIYAIDAKGSVSAHNRDNLSQLWTYDPPEEWQKTLPGGGLVVVGDTVYAVNGGGLVTAINAETGEKRWERVLGVTVRAEPKIQDDHLYISAADNQMLVISTKDGSILWKHQGITEPLRIFSSLPVALHESVVVVPYGSGELYALDAATSRERWRDMVQPRKRGNKSKDINDLAAPPMIAFPKMIAASRSGLIVGMDVRNGMHVWEREFPSIQHAWLADGVTLVLTSYNQAAALDTDTGKIFWTQNLPFEGKKNEASPWRFILMAGSRVLITGINGEAVWLNAQTGEQIGTQSWPKGAWSLPIALNDGWLLVTKDGTLTKLR
ncbi:PQQ-binding-like beta-propeller repeat protein [bacterium]|nr:PQQ-binding-like beta-propeller repeat protein [bacterium]